MRYLTLKSKPTHLYVERKLVCFLHLFYLRASSAVPGHLKMDTFGKSARFQVPNNYTFGCRNQKNITQKLWIICLFCAFTTFGWVLSRFLKIAQFLLLLSRCSCCIWITKQIDLETQIEDSKFKSIWAQCRQKCTPEFDRLQSFPESSSCFYTILVILKI